MIIYSILSKQSIHINDPTKLNIIMNIIMKDITINTLIIIWFKGSSDDYNEL